MSMQHAQYVLLRELLVLVVNSNSFTPSLRHLFSWGFSNSCVSSQVHFWLPRVSAKSGPGGSLLVAKSGPGVTLLVAKSGPGVTLLVAKSGPRGPV